LFWKLGSARARWLAALGLGVLCLAGGGVFITGAGADSSVGGLPGGGPLAGSVPRLVSVARVLGPLDPASRLRIALPLAQPHLAALNAYVAGQYTPGNPAYRRFLTPAEFGARFGAPASEVQAAAGALARLGLMVSRPAANHLYLSATGSVATLERDFGVRLENFRLPVRRGLFAERTFYANANRIHLPDSLRGLVTGVIGLDDSSRPEPQLAAGQRKPSTAAGRAARASTPTQGVDGGASPCGQAVLSGGYTAPALAQGYDFNGMYAKGFHGEGMNAALVEYDDFHDSNVATMKSCFGIKTPVIRRLIDGGSGGAPAAGEAEDMADITTLLSLAPKLAHVYVYVAPNTGTSELDLFNQYVNDDNAPVLSSSWGSCEETSNQSYDQLFGTIAEEAAAQGQQIFEASGDSGAVDCRGYPPPIEGSISVEQEPATPWITGVGGTDLGVKSTETSAGTHDEDTWNDAGAGGGGQSAAWTMPSYQAAYLKATHDHVPGAADDCDAPSGHLCRMVPDLAMNADPDAGGAANGGPTPPQFFPTDVGSPGDATYCATPNCAFATLVGAPGEPPPAGAGGWYPLGGTSLATPTLAAAAVLWDQQAKKAGLGSFGFLNPSLYRLASSATTYKRDFHDITTDTNDAQYDTLDCPSGCNPNHLYSAGTGYDMASGLGSPDVAKLGADLVKQAVNVDLSSSTASVYGYLNGPSTTAPVAVTSGYLHSPFTAKSSASWLHVTASGTLPTTLSWHASPAGLSSGTYHGQITVTGKGGSTATLSVTYSVGPRAKIGVSPGTLHFSERAINSKDQTTTPACGSTVWNDELLDSPDFAGGDYNGDAIDASTRKTLQISNRGPAGSTLHYELFTYSQTSNWMTTDLNPDNNSSGFQTKPSQPLVPSAGAVSGGSSTAVKLASIGNVNTLGGYADLNQGTYTGVVEIRDLADPSTLVKVPVTLVLGNGKGTPTVATTPKTLSVKLARGKETTVDLALSDSSKVCGYAYSLAINKRWATVSDDLYSGTVGASPATAPPSSPSATGSGNGDTPITVSAKGLGPGRYHATVTVESANAGNGPVDVPITLTVPGPKPISGCKRAKPLRFHFKAPQGTRVVKAWVYIDGRRVHTFKGHNLRTITFAWPKLKQFSVRVLDELTNGAEFERKASYDGCRQTGFKFTRVRKPATHKHTAREPARAQVAGFTG
jgi:kumamolisin